MKPHYYGIMIVILCSMLLMAAHGALVVQRNMLNPRRVLSLLYEHDHITQGQGQGETKVKLSSGTLAQVMFSTLKDPVNYKLPPLIFLHGSFHAAWCWTEHYFNYFTNKGYSCYAFSFQGTGGTPTRNGVSKVKIMDHVQDLLAFIEYVDTQEKLADDGGGSRSRPVVIAHSFAGLAVMKYLETLYLNNSSSLSTTLQIGGIAMMCSVPPSGNGKMTMRFLRRSLVDSWKITAGMAFKKCLYDDQLCRTLFFGGEKKRVEFINEKGEQEIYLDDWGITDDDLKRYQGFFLRDSVATIDLGDLAKKLPSNHVDSLGRATFVDRIPPTLVVGAKHDFIVDKEGVLETANYFGVKPIFIDSPHDIMLGRNHLEGAKVIEQWLANNPTLKSQSQQ